MKIYVDIDSTICKTQGNDYKNSIPIPENIAKINKLYDAGNVIFYWTSRGGTTGINLRDFTIDQLKSWGCKCDDVLTGKPGFDLFIDDRAKRIEEL